MRATPRITATATTAGCRVFKRSPLCGTPAVGPHAYGPGLTCDRRGRVALLAGAKSASHLTGDPDRVEDPLPRGRAWQDREAGRAVRNGSRPIHSEGERNTMEGTRERPRGYSS